jgi:hypothetical protein
MRVGNYIRELGAWKEWNLLEIEIWGINDIFERNVLFLSYINI